MNAPVTSSALMRFDRNGLVLLIDPDRPAWAVVNHLGAEIADLCDGQRSVEEIVESVALKYSKPPEAVRNDVTAFLRMLENAGLVFYGEPTPIERLSMDDYIGPITSVAFELTERCNLRCIHCFESAGRQQIPDPTMDDVTAWIDKFSHIPNIAFNLTGGEILIRPDWSQLMRYLVERELTGVVLTNGTLIDDDIAAEMASIALGSLLVIQISLDGPDPKTNDAIRGKGSFEAAVRGIARLSEHGLSDHLVVSFTPSKMNVGSVDRMVDLVLELGVPKIHISLLNRMGRAGQIWDQLCPSGAEMVTFYDRLHARGNELEGKLFVSGDYCSLLHQKIARIPMPLMIGCRLGVDLKIDPSGDVYPCTPLAYDTKYRLGNMHEMNVEDIRTSPVLRELRQQFIPRIEKAEECRACPWKCFCAGGCMGRAELNYGTIYHSDDLCELASELYMRTFFRQADMKRSTTDAKAH